MTKFLLILICVSLLSCNQLDDCLDIRDKYTGNGNYYFELSNNRFSNGTPSDNDPNPTAQVSEEEYNQYQIGDKFCRE
ncbi:MAG: hypothetical protein ACON47_00650 [Flavobacteriaceae bacterium]